MNTEPLSVDAEPTLKLSEDTADSRGSPKPERKLAPGSSFSRATRAKTSSLKDDPPFLIVSDDDEGLPDVFELKDANACHLKIFAITPPAWKNHLDNHLDVELLDLHDRCYARQAVVGNDVNKRSRELLQVIEKNKGECDVMKEIKRDWEEEYEELRSKCKASMTDFEKNPIVAGYQVSLSALESKVASLEAEKARLEAVEASLKKEVDDVKRDRIEVVLKVADMKEPFDLLKVKGYRPSYKKEHTQVGNDLATATFSWLLEFVANPSAPIKVLLSKKPLTLRRHVPSKTQVPVPSSQRATPSSAPASNPMSPPAVVSSVKPQSSQGQ
ncbi:hypothetical protein Tco_1486164 [Tanacetum coccineum]